VRKKVTAVLLVLFLLDLLCLLLVDRLSEGQVDSFRYHHSKSYIFKEMAGALRKYYETYGEYPATLEAVNNGRAWGPVGWDADGTYIYASYFVAHDAAGKRLACLLLSPGFDNKFQVKGECFTRENVGKRPENWFPWTCATSQYYRPEPGKRIDRTGDRFVQLIWDKYYLTNIDVSRRDGPDGYAWVYELPDLSNPPPIPDKPAAE